jgi:hypothetical protein
MIVTNEGFGKGHVDFAAGRGRLPAVSLVQPGGPLRRYALTDEPAPGLFPVDGSSVASVSSEFTVLSFFLKE